jgi:hypothetical protein
LLKAVVGAGIAAERASASVSRLPPERSPPAEPAQRGFPPRARRQRLQGALVDKDCMSTANAADPGVRISKADAERGED